MEFARIPWGDCKIVAHFMPFFACNSHEKMVFEIIKKLSMHENRNLSSGIQPLIYGFYFIFVLFEGPVNA
jgi:hypothetical protein